MTISVSALDAVRQPIEKAHGLSNAHYVNNDVYDAECKSVLQDQWAGLAVASDVPEAG